MKILIVDDETDEHDNAKDWAPRTLSKLKEEGLVNDSVVSLFELDFAETVEEAKSKKIEEFDFAIVDMKLNEKSDDSGEDVVKYIEKLCLRIPVFIYTGTDADISVKFYKKCIKGRDNFDTIFRDCFELEKTGLLDIMKRKGLIDKELQSVFCNSLIESLRESKWLEYAKHCEENTKKALLRYTLSSLLQHLDFDDDEEFFPEEVYLYPLQGEYIPVYRIGSILKCKKDESYVVVVSPACDIALHNGNMKTDCIQILTIDKIESVEKNICRNKITASNDKERLRKNAYVGYYHYLPPIKNFEGGYINFRKCHSMKLKKLRSFFEKPKYHIAPQFCKDIVSRFSSYYARQGQPVIKLT